MDKILIVSDIDDVIRNLRDSLIKVIKKTYKVDNFEYTYKNILIEDFFKQYSGTSQYFNMFNQAKYDNQILSFYKEMINDDKISLIFLSANKYKNIQKITRNYLKKYFSNKTTVYFVDSSIDKITFLNEYVQKNKIDRKNVIMVDDRADTVYGMNCSGYNGFYYIKYVDDYIYNINKYQILNHGSFDNFKEFVNSIL